ncbi:MAG: UvrB/UvrC motif-containing protein [Bacillota bacterium]|jgi:protein arginine kinase activator
MLCERCQQKPAVVHFTEIINDQKKQMHLCESCVREMQAQSFGFAPQMNLHKFLAGLLNTDLNRSFPGSAQHISDCQKCGLSEAKFIQQGLLGCGECYTHFAGRLQPLVKRIHGHSVHEGKVPQRISSKVSLKKKIDQLRANLKEAVGKEEFERAAELRDKIRDLEEELGREG